MSENPPGSNCSSARKSNGINRWVALLLATSFAVSSPSLALAGPVDDLLAKPYRPTVAEIKAAFGNQLPAQNPFGTPNEDLQKEIRANAPAAIAAFEKAFPGATYAPLGRDSVFLGNIMDSFYQALGQDRVRRINASGPSLTGVDDDIVAFLEASGFDRANFNGAPPFVLFDATDWADSSQSSKYVRAVLNSCRPPECDRALLMQKFNFVNTGIAKQIGSQIRVAPGLDVIQFLTQQAQQVSAPSVGRPHRILSIPVPTSFMYTAEYHKPFGLFTRQNRRIETKPGAMSDLATRRQILADDFETIKTTSTPQFLRDVDLQARLLGYAFPRHRVRSDEETAQIRQLITAEASNEVHRDMRLERVLETRDPNAFAAELAAFFRWELRASDVERLASLLKGQPRLKEVFKTRVFEDFVRVALEGKPVPKGVLSVYDAVFGSAAESLNRRVHERRQADIVARFNQVLQNDLSSADNVFKALNEILGAHPNLTPTARESLRLRMVLAGTAKGRLSRSFVAQTLNLWISASGSSDEAATREISDILKRSTLARTAFYGTILSSWAADPRSLASRLPVAEAIHSRLPAAQDRDFFLLFAERVLHQMIAEFGNTPDVIAAYQKALLSQATTEQIGPRLFKAALISVNEAIRSGRLGAERLGESLAAVAAYAKRSDVAARLPQVVSELVANEAAFKENATQPAALVAALKGLPRDTESAARLREWLGVSESQMTALQSSHGRIDAESRLRRALEPLISGDASNADFQKALLENSSLKALEGWAPEAAARLRFNVGLELLKNRHLTAPFVAGLLRGLIEKVDLGNDRVRSEIASTLKRNPSLGSAFAPTLAALSDGMPPERRTNLYRIVEAWQGTPLAELRRAEVRRRFHASAANLRLAIQRNSSGALPNLIQAAKQAMEAAGVETLAIRLDLAAWIRNEGIPGQAATWLETEVLPRSEDFDAVTYDTLREHLASGPGFQELWEKQVLQNLNRRYYAAKLSVTPEMLQKKDKSLASYIAINARLKGVEPASLTVEILKAFARIDGSANPTPHRPSFEADVQNSAFDPLDQDGRRMALIEASLGLFGEPGFDAASLYPLIYRQVLAGRDSEGFVSRLREYAAAHPEVWRTKLAEALLAPEFALRAPLVTADLYREISMTVLGENDAQVARSMAEAVVRSAQVEDRIANAFFAQTPMIRQISFQSLLNPIARIDTVEAFVTGLRLMARFASPQIKTTGMIHSILESHLATLNPEILSDEAPRQRILESLRADPDLLAAWREFAIRPSPNSENRAAALRVYDAIESDRVTSRVARHREAARNLIESPDSQSQNSSWSHAIDLTGQGVSVNFRPSLPLNFQKLANQEIERRETPAEKARVAAGFLLQLHRARKNAKLSEQEVLLAQQLVLRTANGFEAEFAAEVARAIRLTPSLAETLVSAHQNVIASVSYPHYGEVDLDGRIYVRLIDRLGLRDRLDQALLADWTNWASRMGSSLEDVNVAERRVRAAFVAYDVRNPEVLKGFFDALAVANDQGRLNDSALTTLLSTFAEKIGRNEISPLAFAEGLRRSPGLTAKLKRASPWLLFSNQSNSNPAIRSGLIKLSTTAADLFDVAALENDVVQTLTEGLFGVGIDQESVALKRLADWSAGFIPDLSDPHLKRQAISLRLGLLTSAAEAHAAKRLSDRGLHELLASLGLSWQSSLVQEQAFPALVSSPTLRAALATAMQADSSADGARARTALGQLLFNAEADSNSSANPFRRAIETMKRSGSFRLRNEAVSENGLLLHELARTRLQRTRPELRGRVVIEHLEAVVQGIEGKLLLWEDFLPNLTASLEFWPRDDQSLTSWLHRAYRENKEFRMHWRAAADKMKGMPMSPTKNTFLSLHEKLPSRCSLAIGKIL